MPRYSARMMLPLIACALAAPAGPARAEAVPVRVDRDACARVVAYVPDPGVAYQPGVDVNGRPVAPADLPGSTQLQLPDSFVISLELDLRHSVYPVPGPKGLDPKVQLGIITVEGNRVFYNGQPLDDGEQARLAAACRDFMKRQR